MSEVDNTSVEEYTFDNPSKGPEFKDHCEDISRWNVEKVHIRGFNDAVEGDGTAGKKAYGFSLCLRKLPHMLRFLNSEVYIFQMEQVYFPIFFFAHATMET